MKALKIFLLSLASVSFSMGALTVQFAPLGDLATGDIQLTISGTTPLSFNVFSSSSIDDAFAENYTFALDGTYYDGVNAFDYSVNPTGWTTFDNIDSSTVTGSGGFRYQSGVFTVYGETALSAGDPISGTSYTLLHSFDDLGISPGDSAVWVYETVSGNTAVSWTAVPEPAAFSGILAIAALVVSLRFRRKALS